MLTVSIYYHQVHCPDTELRTMCAAAALSPTALSTARHLNPRTFDSVFPHCMESVRRLSVGPVLIYKAFVSQHAEGTPEC